MIKRLWATAYGRQLTTAFPRDNGEGLDDGTFVEIKRVEPPLKKAVICSKCKRPYNDHTIKELYDHKMLVR